MFRLWIRRIICRRIAQSNPKKQIVNKKDYDKPGGWEEILSQSEIKVGQ